ncbi:MAG: FAD-binding oxidoreductase, partial [Eubacteriales bacterium]|nr:FAD-binding oxidoreductase [Eubacteriales bacterium]
MKELKDLILPMGEEYVDYLHDESRQTGQADSISFPKSEEEVCEIMRVMHARENDVTIQGSLTGLAAAAVPDGGHILSMRKMNRVLGMRIGKEGAKRDPRCRYRHDPEREAVYVRVQPGLTLNEFREYLRTRQMPNEGWDEASMETYQAFLQMPEQYFPPDPTEGSASLGGMCACNSSGAKSFYYGSTRGYIEAFRLVLADGDVLALRRGQCYADGRHFVLRTEKGRIIEGDLPGYQMPHCKNAAGYYAADNMDLVDLVIGSDGTFGIFTELELRLIEMPKVIFGLNCFFKEESEAVAFSGIIRRTCPELAAMEYLDQNALNLLREEKDKDFKIPEEAKCMLYLEIHAAEHDSAMEQVDAILTGMEIVGADPDTSWIAESYGDRQKLLEMRHMVPEKVNARIAAYKRVHPKIAKTGSDMALPDAHFLNLLDMYETDLNNHGFDYAVWGHFGDNHLHVNVLPRTPEEMQKAKEMFEKWAVTVTSLGGTVSAEHGTGKIKAILLAIMYGG